LGQTLYCLCLPGAVAALLFPAWTVFPQWNLINLQSFLIHALLIFGPLLEVQRGTLHPDIRRLWKTWIFLALVVPCIYLMDRRFDANYFFLNAGSPGSPLEWLIQRMGNPGFLLGYAIIVLAVNIAMYGLYALHSHRNSCRTGLYEK
ncbi:MAG: YwaF family protein, partial [Lachnospiraceae bacterium]|nr:YwaF family protein [Lachnospiraceae bacterium]